MIEVTKASSFSKLLSWPPISLLLMLVDASMMKTTFALRWQLGVLVGVVVLVVVVVVVVSVELHASSITQCSWYLFTCRWRSSTL